MPEDSCAECDDVFPVDLLVDHLCLACRDWRIAQDLHLVPADQHWTTSDWNRL